MGTELGMNQLHKLCINYIELNYHSLIVPRALMLLYQLDELITFGIKRLTECSTLNLISIIKKWNHNFHEWIHNCYSLFKSIVGFYPSSCSHWSTSFLVSGLEKYNICCYQDGCTTSADRLFPSLYLWIKWYRHYGEYTIGHGLYRQLDFLANHQTKKKK